MKFNTALSVIGTILLSIEGSLSQLDVCGQAPLNNKIVGGEDATAGSWPWQVSIQSAKYGGHFCGGSLISKDWVLSAAHCFQNSLGTIEIYLGRQSQSGLNPYEEFRTVSQVINHPNYDSASNDNDIALLQLSSSVTFSDYIKPVCLAATGSVFTAGTKSWVTGWGALQSGGSSPDILQEVMIPIVSNSDCNNAYGGGITSNMICAGLLNEGGKDSCQGDSGGPMVSRNGSVWIQSGIVSFGNGCADPKYPGVYARVSQYNNWINYNIGSNQPGYVEFNSSEFGSSLNLLLFSISLTFSFIPFICTIFFH
ncbi:trypsin-2-like isoform X2 [Ctenopharyngodon idella]|uniref:trypsin-2-like isoform X2 n=1 Tax=Ctenopharyngodon idella TaxID=7959 RepID=UPI0022320D59|nr:trypsin-2-like isoform X2 [Ctenopharyngodon idella]